MAPNPVTNDFSLSSDQRDEFTRRGVIRLPGLISADAVRRAREVVLERLARLGLWRDDGWRLDALPRPEWPDKGFKVSEAIGNKRPEIEALVKQPALLAVVNELLEERSIDHSFFRRPQVLFTLPNIDVWRLPGGWHTDAPRLASGISPGVQLFGFLDYVGPGGGGTLVVAGSHRLGNCGRYLRRRDLIRRLRREPFFSELLAGRANLEGGLPRAQVDETLVEVMELTGAPGDAYLVDMRILHEGAPNAAARPRLMFTHRFVRADAVREMAEAGYGGITEYARS